MSDAGDQILPGTGRGTTAERRGGGGSSLRKPEVYIARKLRRNMSLPEVMLWNHVRGQRLGFRVRHQHPIGPYIVDFYVSQCRPVIEIDGEAHNRGERPRRDQGRNAFLEGKGYRLLRIPAAEVLRNIEGVIRGIVAAAASPLHHAAHGPPPRAGEDL